MSANAPTVEAEITALEERLRQAELGPDPDFFAEALDDNAVLVSETGEPFFAKAKVVEAHRPGAGPKFKRVEMSNMKIVDHGDVAVVTCLGTYEAESTITLKFMRVWAKKADAGRSSQDRWRDERLRVCLTDITSAMRKLFNLQRQ